MIDWLQGWFALVGPSLAANWLERARSRLNSKTEEFFIGIFLRIDTWVKFSNFASPFNTIEAILNRLENFNF